MKPAAPLDLVQRMEDVKDPRGLFAFKEAIRTADPAVAVRFEKHHYGKTLYVILTKGERHYARPIEGEVPCDNPATGERWYRAYDLFNHEEYESLEDFDLMRAKVVAQLVTEVQEPTGGGG